MTRRAAIQMDPIASINPLKDTTFLLGLEAQQRGYELWYYTPDTLSHRDGAIVARAHRLSLHNDPAHYYDLEKPEILDLGTMDVILLRQDPPFDMSYLTTTYLLEKLLPKTLVVNHPAHVRDYPEKLFPLLFSKYLPPTLITRDIEQMRDFRKIHKDVIIKPLYGHSGRAVFRMTPQDHNFESLTEVLLASSNDPWIMQLFLTEMKDKEYRIILIDGEIAGTMGRIPAEGETRASFHVGAKYIKAEPTERHREICAALGPVLKENGLIFTGIDIIGDYLTEINITSPGSLSGFTQLYGRKLESDIWDAIESKLH